jgi:hypothetical protein
MAPDSHGVFLRVELKNERAVELVDLTTSLLALGQAYEDYVVSRGLDPIRGNVKLYIKELRGGSIVADLQTALDQASFVWDHREVFVAFLTHFNDLVQIFLSGLVPAPASRPSRIEAERVAQILDPVAKDGGSQLFLQVHGDVNIHQHTYNSQEANTAQNRIRKFLGDSLPRSQYFQQEPMTLFQVRDDPAGKAGDRGIIEKFSKRPVKLYFMNEEAKRRVLDQVDNPLGQIFFVDGEVGMAGEKPAIYKIYVVHDSENQPDPE